MVQEQFLNYVLAKKDFSVLLNNGITEDYFTEYADEYNFIKDHFENYKVVPDVETFVSNFPNFDVLEVNESERYLVNTIREEYLYAKSVPVIKKAAELLKADANEAAQYLQSELVNLTPNYSIPSVDIIHSKDRFDLFTNKSQSSDKWFIPSGFEELDDIIYGFQRGEEFVVIVARTGNGKSWVIVKMAQHGWLLGEDVGYISPEMTASKIGYRFDTINHKFSNRALVRGDKNAIPLDEYNAYFETLNSKPNKFVVSTPADFNKKITVSKLRNYIMQNKLSMLFIDGITYLTDERYKKGDNKTTTLTNISEDLMQLSVEMKVPIIVVVQSNRGGVKEEADATPELEDIRDSDGISHNATKVLSLKKKDDALTMAIKKNRDGVVGTSIQYQWDPDIGEFIFIPESERKRIRNDEDDIKVEKPKLKKEGRVAF